MRWVYDDGGRAEAGFRGVAGDCVARAIAIASERPYRDVYDELNEVARSQATRASRPRSSARDGVTRDVYDAYLAALGWIWTPTMTIGSGCQVHLKKPELPSGRLVVRVTRHVTAVIDGVIHDTHDPSRRGKRCVYGYFTGGDAVVRA